MYFTEPFRAHLVESIVYGTATAWLLFSANVKGIFHKKSPTHHDPTLNPCKHEVVSCSLISQLNQLIAGLTVFSAGLHCCSEPARNLCVLIEP